jgi:hypothetical protein
VRALLPSARGLRKGPICAYPRLKPLCSLRLSYSAVLLFRTRHATLPLSYSAILLFHTRHATLPLSYSAIPCTTIPRMASLHVRIRVLRDSLFRNNQPRTRPVQRNFSAGYGYKGVVLVH